MNVTVDNFYISHTHKGFYAKAIPGRELPREIYETFSYAIGCYGYLVLLNETIDSEEWIKRIENHYANSSKRNRVIEAIKTAMPTIKTEV